MTDGEVVLDVRNVREVIAAAKEFSPRLATRLRRELRGVGNDIIAAQKAALDAPLPSGIAVSGQRSRATYNAKKNKVSRVKRNVYADVARTRGESSGEMREAIKSGLKTRIVAGKTRQGLTIKTTASAMPDGKKLMPKTWTSIRFRHKVWGRTPWVYQKGQPYFWAPVTAGSADALAKAEAAIAAALAEISN